jgi:hypothetical protein
LLDGLNDCIGERPGLPLVVDLENLRVFDLAGIIAKHGAGVVDLRTSGKLRPLATLLSVNCHAVDSKSPGGNLDLGESSQRVPLAGAPIKNDDGL